MKNSIIAMSLALLTSPFAVADEFCPDTVGVMILHAAWITPKYTSCTFQSISPQVDGGKELTFKVTGISKMSGKEVWVNGIIKVDKDWRIQSTKWGSYKAVVAPGVTTLLLGRVLVGMLNQ